MSKEYFITQVHAAIRAARLTRRHATARAEDVPQGVCKEYPRMRQIQLLEPLPITTRLDEALAKRHSLSNISDYRAFTLQEISTLLGAALRAHADGRRPYPSGGKLFPIETYLIGDCLENEPRGVYHYNPNKHVLEFLWKSSFSMGHVFRKPQAPLPSVAIVLTSVWGRGSAKYGDLNYYHSLIEAGHVAENLLLTSTALNFAARPHSGFDDTTVSEILDLDERAEQPVYTIMLAAGERGQTTPAKIED